MCLSMSYTVEQVLAQKHNYMIRDVPNELRNFHAFLSKSPQLADQESFQLTRTDEEGVIKLCDQIAGRDNVDLGKVKAILNKLTKQNYDTLIVDLKRKTHRSLFDDERVVDILLQNVKLCEHYSQLYTKLIHDLDQEEGQTSISKAIGNKSLQAFQLFQKADVRQDLDTRLAEISDPDIKMEIEGKCKRENVAIVVFLGHLYAQGLLSHANMYTVLRTLCVEREPGKIDVYNLDFLLSLVPIVRTRLQKSDMPTSDRVVRHLQALQNNSAVPIRLRFRIQDFFSPKRR